MTYNKESQITKAGSARTEIQKAGVKFRELYGEEKGEHLFKRESAFALLAINESEKLQRCSVESLITSVAQVALLDLTLNPALSQCALVPFKDKCTLMVMVEGLIQLAYRTGLVKSINAQVIREGEDFTYVAGEKIKHRPKLNHGGAAIEGAYAVAKLSSGGKVFCVMGIEELNKRRDMGYEASLMWSQFEETGYQKVVIRRLLKLIPKGELKPEIAELLSEEIEST